MKPTFPIGSSSILNLLLMFIDVPLSIYLCYPMSLVLKSGCGDWHLAFTILAAVCKTVACMALTKHCLSVAGHRRKVSISMTMRGEVDKDVKEVLTFCILYFVGILSNLCCYNVPWQDSAAHNLSEEDVFLVKWYEGESHKGFSFMSMSMLSAMFYPLLFCVVFYEIFLVYWKVIMGMIICSFSCLVAMTIHLESLPMTLTLLYYFSLVLLFLYGMQQRIVREEKLQADHEEARELSKAHHINQFDENMRSMVGNVAHDLKTPLASFVTGLETIKCMLTEGVDLLEAKVMRAEGTVDDCGGCEGRGEEKNDSNPSESVAFLKRILSSLKSTLDGCLECVENMSNTNNFMLMTIHRCIDYAKASKGLKLVPKHETIDLLATLSLPLNCMKDIQQRVSITMNPIPQVVSSHIITDKQWLQENLLCLLSNAVKYSNAGSVNVSVGLEEVEVYPLEGGGKDEEEGEEDYEEEWLRRSRRQSERSGFHSVQSKSMVFSQKKNDNNDGSSSPEHIRNAITTRDAFSMTRVSIVHPTCLVRSVTMLRIEVEDEGIGMSEEAMADLFSPFKQTQRLAGGTGLGLFSLAKRLEALQGQCGVSKRRDGLRGSIFWFRFPYREDEQRQLLQSLLSMSASSTALPKHVAGNNGSAPATSAVTISMTEIMDKLRNGGATRRLLSPRHPIQPSLRAASGDVSSSSSRPRILLVDDTPSVVKITSMLLRKKGFAVTVAENGADALDIIQRELENQRFGLEKSDEPGGSVSGHEATKLQAAFDCILMDLHMPIMDGLEATKRLRQIEQEYGESFSKWSDGLRHLILGVSANDDEETRLTMMDMGFDGSLSKPFTMNAFNQVLSDLGVDLKL